MGDGGLLVAITLEVLTHMRPLAYYALIGIAVCVGIAVLALIVGLIAGKPTPAPPAKEGDAMPTERLVDVKLITLSAIAANEEAARAEVAAALAAGQIVKPTDEGIVIRQRVELRGRGRTE